MKFIDFFAGIGGFRRGMELSGHECVGFCEWDKYATMSYTSMHLITDVQREYLATLPLKQRQKEILKDEYRNGEWYSNDIRNVDAGSLPKADCWCAGFPCQDISVAGKQLGFDGNRSSLYFQIIRLAQELKEEDRPQWIFLENVKNLLSINNGWDFARVLFALDEVGYDIEWGVLNSKDFYVPQNRERIFIIGHLRGRSGREVFPIEGASGENCVSILGHREGYRRNLQTFSPSGITETLSTCSGGGREHHTAIPIMASLKTGFRETDVGGTLMARDYKGIGNQDMTAVAIPILTPDRVNKRQNGRRFKENGEPSFTLTGQDRHGVGIKVKEATKKGYAIAHEGDSINLSVIGSKTRRGRVGEQIANTLDTSCNQGIFVKINDATTVYAVWYEKYQCYIAIRKLTPKECFRLQGWTDDYFEKAEFVNSNSQLYKQAGNGVTVTVIQSISEKMKV